MKNRILISVSVILSIALCSVLYSTNRSIPEINQLKSELQQIKSQLVVATIKRPDANAELPQISKQLRKTDTQLRNLHTAQQQLVDRTASLEEQLPDDGVDDASSVSNDHEQVAIAEENALEQEKREIEMTFSQLSQSLEQEGIDAEWAASVENAVVSKFEDDSPDGVSLIEAQCRSSFCRIVIGDDQGNTDFDARALLAEQITDAEGIYHSTVDENGHKTTEYYISRNGYSLPLSHETAEN